jgi:hypothetical protein
MISFTPFALPPSFEAPSTSQKRIVGWLPPTRLVYSVSSAASTEIIEVTDAGDPSVVYSVAGCVDVVSADFARDLDLVAYTERIARGASLHFRASLSCITSRVTVTAFEDGQPTSGRFITCPDSPTRLIYAVGDQIIECRADVKPTKIAVRPVRRGVRLRECQAWIISNSMLYVIHAQKSLTQVTFSHVAQGVSYEFESDVNPVLGSDVALLPTCQSDRPFYRVSSGNFFVASVQNDLALVQQVGGESVAFSIDFVMAKFSCVVSIPGVKAVLPLNFLWREPLLVVFSLNCCAVIDFAVFPPVTYGLPEHLCGGLDKVGVAEDGLVADLTTGKVYRCDLSAAVLPAITDRTLMRIVAVVAARLPCHIPDIFQQLPTDAELVHFFRYLFAAMIREPGEVGTDRHFYRTLLSIEKAFPSAGPLSRIDKFCELVYTASRTPLDDCAAGVVNQLKLENQFILVLRAGIDMWVEKFAPVVLRTFAVVFAIHGECYCLSGPELPRAKWEMRTACEEVASTTLARQLENHLVIDRDAAGSHREAAFWKKRLSSLNI